MVVDVVVGLQWGDEGKGKVVDWMTEHYDIIARYNGGDNAGHTVVINKKKYKFHLLPSGVLRKKKLILGSSMVINPEVLLSEIEAVKREIGNIDLTISAKAHVIFPYHIKLDEFGEKKQTLGTTKRGIGPAYEFKVGRRYGIRIWDLVTGTFEEVLERIELPFKIDKKEIIEKYREYGRLLKEYVGFLHEIIPAYIEKGYRILAEGAQGVLLDIDHGTYPFVTSSNSVPQAVPLSLEFSPKYLGNVYGVFKAYVTGVGRIPIVGKMEEPIATYVREKGNEYGTTTGRPRDVGWLDLVALKYAIKIAGADYLIMTKLDVLNGLKELKVIVAYEINGTETEKFVPDGRTLLKAKPIYETLPGFNFDVEKVLREGWEALPPEAKRYIEFIEDYIGKKIQYLSLGPERNAIIKL